MTKAVVASLAMPMIAVAGCGSDDATDTVQGFLTEPTYVELRGVVPGGLLKTLGDDADVATGYGCFSHVSPGTDLETSTTATKCTIKFGDVTRKFIRTAGGKWEEIEP